MDRFIIRTPRGQTPSPSKPKGKRLVQSTIESMRGVVVIEQVLRLKALLKVEDQTTEVLLESLKELNSKIPSREVLKSTKIGHTVNCLTKHKEHDVRKLAVEIVDTWKTYFEAKQDKPMMEVKCDNKSEQLRKAGRKLLASALSVPEKNLLVETIEREAFHQHGRFVTHPYRRSMRSLVFALKNKDDVREKVLKKELTVRDFVTQYRKIDKT